MSLKYIPVALRTIRSSLCIPSTVTIAGCQQLQSVQSTRNYCCAKTPISVVDYAFIKKLPSEPKKLLIDVREPNELQETGQIPCSINIPLGQVGQELGAKAELFKSKYGRDKPQPNSEIIFHCKMGKRSQKAAEAAVALGFKNVKNYEGSWNDWAEKEGLCK